MTNTLDYLDWRGDLSFSSAPFCEVDMFICSQLSSPDYSGIVPETGEAVTLEDASERYFFRHPGDGADFGVLQSTSVLPMLKALAASERFRKVRLCDAKNIVDQENEEQFCAVTVLLPDGTMCISFRGTDDTIIAWKEDFNLATKPVVPAQADALNYLKRAASAHRGKIRVCGHSKGGNLAAYSSIVSDRAVRERIITAYNNDGPGFMSDFAGSPEYAEAAAKIYTILPQDSLVGMFFETTANSHVIESTAHGGAAQHNPYSWTVLGTSFSHRSDLSDDAKRNNSVMREWIKGSDPDERNKFADTIFSVFESAGTKTLTEFSENKLRHTAAVMKAIAGFDKDTRDNATMFVKRLIEAIRGEQ